MSGDERRRHFHGDSCPGGHTRPNGDRCIHESWICDHCHDDPPAFHVCPACGAEGRRS